MHLNFKNKSIEIAESNPYLNSNADMFMSLYEIVRDNQDCYAMILSHSRNDVGKWLDNALNPILTEYRSEKPNYIIPTRNKLWFVFHGITTVLKCPVCNITVFKKVNSIFQDNCPHCSQKCAGSDVESIRKTMNTKSRKYGDPTFNNRRKFKDTVNSMPDERIEAWHTAFKRTCNEKFGVDSYMETDEFRKQLADWVKGTYGEQYDNILQVTEVRLENEKIKLEKYGHVNWSNWEEGRKTCLKNHGVDVIFKSEEFKQAYAEMVADINEKRAATCMERFGVPFGPAGKYEYDGCLYDSKPELAFAVWSADKKIKVERNKSLSFQFEYSGITHEYWPDFIIDGKPVEIKGDQFFREDGTMFCPYRKKECSDEDYAYMCGLYEAKHQCMLSNNVRIIRTDEYLQYIDYVEKTYGKDFFDKYRKIKDETGK